jgi:F1F0 ATPase subunit 2
MTMIDALPLLLAGATGLLLGVIFFGGLWWTIRKGLSSQLPAFWFLGSLLARTSIVMVGFYFVSGSHWERLLSCLMGFVAARLLVTRLIRSAGADPVLTEGASYAP